MTVELKELLQKEIDVLPWSALVRDFAFGRLYCVRQPWTLVDAALVLKCDQAALLKEEMKAGRFQIPSDDEVKTWQLSNPKFNVIVMNPFVLVQAAETVC